MISGNDIHKRYGDVEVLRGVDMHINKGEVVAIVGPSGSGKSTLLHILGTLDYPDAGFIEVSGTRIRYQPRVSLSPAAWWKRLLTVLVDLLIVGTISYGIITAFSQQNELLTPSWLAGGYNFLLLLCYYVFFEFFTGRTPGKMVAATKVVVANEGTRAGFVTILVRNLARFLPLEFLSHLAARPLAWHDSLSNTIVIDSKHSFREKIEDRLSARELAFFRNKHMGFVFQFHHLLPEFTALENVCIPGWLAGRKKSEVRAEAERLLNMLGLGHRVENKPNELSGGEQQRVAVARALINKPDIVFADEPTGNLDSANARDLHELFFRLRDEFQQTFLIVTHNEELASLSDRTLHMKDGKIVQAN